ncbi:hypothetical protein TTRE_0000836801 [Trichuris trichiura]|uniref:Uncharacterized protein n=1 Tax=Trichuris trichiura TaxID=36087 RepID=A0A077ZMU8_TRITR|nr:hypothetical protein TTRE_0000836801 [Trichuris trichiura]
MEQEPPPYRRHSSEWVNPNDTIYALSGPYVIWIFNALPDSIRNHCYDIQQWTVDWCSAAEIEEKALAYRHVRLGYYRHIKKQASGIAMSKYDIPGVYGCTFRKEISATKRNHTQEIIWYMTILFIDETNEVLIVVQQRSVSVSAVKIGDFEALLLCHADDPVKKSGHTTVDSTLSQPELLLNHKLTSLAVMKALLHVPGNTVGAGTDAPAAMMC